MRDYSKTGYAPSSGRSRSKIRQLSGAVVPSGVTAINVGVFGAVAIGLYAMYKKFISDTPLDKTKAADEKTALSDYTTRAASTAVSLDSLAKDLKKQGYVVANTHSATANSLNSAMDAAIVDHANVIRIVKSMGIISFQLTAISYGQRELKNYRNSLAHIFDASVWSDMFAEKKLYGGLKFHLETVLSSSEYSSLSAYTNSVP